MYHVNIVCLNNTIRCSFILSSNEQDDSDQQPQHFFDDIIDDYSGTPMIWFLIGQKDTMSGEVGLQPSSCLFTVVGSRLSPKGMRQSTIHYCSHHTLIEKLLFSNYRIYVYSIYIYHLDILSSFVTYC